MKFYEDGFIVVVFESYIRWNAFIINWQCHPYWFDYD